MHSLICGLITATMVLLPWKDGGGSVKAWMERYEAFLYQQMYDNFEREKRERNAEICQNPSESEVSIEQTASEEAHDVLADRPVSETVVEVLTQSVPEETADSRPEVAVPEPQAATPLYEVDGYIPDQVLQTYLYTRLCESGIGYFMPYAVCLIAQESTWNPMSENPNGLDKGLLQYRTTYWPTLEWWNPYAEIDVFVQQMANRAAIGCTISEMISRHNQSDWGPYCQSYVDAVMSHSERLIQIR